MEEERGKRRRCSQNVIFVLSFCVRAAESIKVIRSQGHGKNADASLCFYFRWRSVNNAHFDVKLFLPWLDTHAERKSAASAVCVRAGALRSVR